MNTIFNSNQNIRLNHIFKRSEKDAFSRLRISEPLTLFDYHNVNNIDSVIFNEKITLGATSVHSNDSYRSLTVTPTNGSRVVRQSRQYISYQPGKSKLILLSGVFETSGGITGIRSRMGIFDDHNDKNVDSGGNGLFFELDGQTLYVVERSSSNGTGQTDIRVPQSRWNIDSLGASSLNPSKKKISDFSKACLLAIDFEWLGVGFSRFGFVIDGVIHYVHKFSHKKVSKPYMRYAKLPIRHEIENVSASSQGTQRMICGSVLSEGGYNLKGIQFGDGTNTTSFSVPDTKYVPILSLKLKDKFNRNTLYLKQVKFLISASTNKPIHYHIVHNPITLLGTNFRDVNDGSMAQISITGTTIVGGKIVNSGYIESKGTDALLSSVDDLLQNIPICSDITGTSDKYVISGKAIGGSANVYCEANWLEIN